MPFVLVILQYYELNYHLLYNVLDLHDVSAHVRPYAAQAHVECR